MSDALEKTDRTTITRHSERASYDRDVANAILDEALVAHVGFDAGTGVTVLPMAYARIDDVLYLHGAVASRWLSSFNEGRDVCITVTLVDGLVLARSAFSHSLNYRSVVAFGRATLVTDDDEKHRAFRALTDHLVPGRWADTRQPDRKETNATTVLRVPVAEASVKIRSGPPADMEKDMALDHWAGVIPLKMAAGEPEPDPDQGDKPTPAYVRNYRRGGRGA